MFVHLPHTCLVTLLHCARTGGEKREEKRKKKRKRETRTQEGIIGRQADRQAGSRCPPFAWPGRAGREKVGAENCARAGVQRPHPIIVSRRSG